MREPVQVENIRTTKPGLRRRETTVDQEKWEPRAALGMLRAALVRV